MFGISSMEMLFLLLLALLLFGGKRIPELARSLGKGVSEFKKGVREFEGEMATEPESNRPSAQPSTTPVAQVAAQPQQFKFDPYTGKPLTPEASQEAK
jgi:sec-independent protein translocase protein TatA